LTGQKLRLRGFEIHRDLVVADAEPPLELPEAGIGIRSNAGISRLA
jgi:hypothetical protein